MPNETPQSKWTTGDNDVPGSTTVGPGNDDTLHQYAVNSEDVTGYVGVDEEYRTYADAKFKPLPVGQGVEDDGDEVSESDEGDDLLGNSRTINPPASSVHRAPAKKVAPAKAAR